MNGTSASAIVSEQHRSCQHRADHDATCEVSDLGVALGHLMVLGQLARRLPRQLRSWSSIA